MREPDFSRRAAPQPSGAPTAKDPGGADPGTASRSPIKDKPLRLPGQSSSEELDRILEDEIVVPLVFIFLFIGLAAFEWYRYLMDVKPSPVSFTLAAMVMMVYQGWRLWRARPRIKQLRLGIEGEKAVGQYLERLGSQGYRVFHDVIGSGFNVDHVLIGPAGVFSVETKTWSKPASGQARIQFDGDKLTRSGYPVDRDPVAQARAQAAWLRSMLAESTGRTFEVFPVVLFPGWFIEGPAAGPRSVWVLEPKALPAFIKNEPLRLVAEDVHLAAFHLSRFVRTAESSKRQ